MITGPISLQQMHDPPQLLLCWHLLFMIYRTLTSLCTRGRVAIVRQVKVTFVVVDRLIVKLLPRPSINKVIHPCRHMITGQLLQCLGHRRQVWQLSIVECLLHTHCPDNYANS